MSNNKERYYEKRKRHYKDESFIPKNLFKAKPKEVYEKAMDIEISPERKEKLKIIWSQPQKLVKPEEYAFKVHCGYNIRQYPFIAFIKYVTPPRRMTNDHYIYLVKKKPNNLKFQGNIVVGQKSKERVVPIILQAIDNLSI